MYKKDLWCTTIASSTPGLPVPWTTTIEMYSLRAADRAAEGSWVKKGFLLIFGYWKKQIMWIIYSGFWGIFCLQKDNIHFADEIYYYYAKIKLTFSSFFLLSTTVSEK